ncbi:MAG: SDR family NAD(P)-dependent oxidoreductase [Halioglobus sp.]
MTKETSKITWQGGVAVITGAASGIGEALAHEAALQMGMKVVLADIDESGLDRVTADLISQGAEVLAVVTDVADAASVVRLAEKTFEHFGSVRLLVNNAGIETLGFSWEIPPAQWEKILGVNIHGVVNGVNAFAPRMIASGEPCVIANMASIAAISIAPIQASYVMSKHAVLAFSECLHLEMEMKSSAVQISAILPGPVKTQIFESVGEQTSPVAAQHRQQMMDLLDNNGITAQEAAQMIFRQLAAGDFWVSTHPEMTQMMAAQRARHLSSLDSPSMDVESAFSTET